VRVSIEARNVTYEGGRRERLPAGARVEAGDDCSVSSSVRPERIGLLLTLLAAGAVLVWRARRQRRS
jgi:MYXO-CTERM domain-containing protein